MNDFLNSLMRGFMRHIADPLLDFIIGPNALSNKMPTVWHYRVILLCIIGIIIFSIFRVNN